MGKKSLLCQKLKKMCGCELTWFRKTARQGRGLVRPPQVAGGRGRPLPGPAGPVQAAPGQTPHPPLETPSDQLSHPS